ncbi:MAG: DNA gyrase/topoisomerase IV subunit A, partial [Lewinella sp.]|nr:DNA gyrase/topoisomerase IV subunit A [Lewinella sp.]
LLLAQGVEGIAVGLSTKILPHNIGELIKASIKILEDKKFTIYPDFDTGGSIDVSEYNNGKRGGKILIRSKIEKRDKNTLVITELPYGVTTSSLIESIVKANDKGKIKIKKIVDNTAQDVEILIDLVAGTSPDLTIDALYAFTNCSVSVSPNACVIVDNRPEFLSVNEILRMSTEHTKDLLRQELEIKKADLEQKWHNASLEKIFIENRVYHDIEECETWEAMLETIDREMRRYIADPDEKLKAVDTRIQLMRPFTEEDILRLTEIKIKRISKFNTFKADEHILQLESDIAQTLHDLQHLTEFAITYFEDLYERYGSKYPRRTEITSFEQIDVVQVAANNVKLYANLKEGFIGWGLKKDQEIRECSDLDDIIAFKKDGTFKVSKIGDKVFMGENILHVDVWKKGDDRTTYNLIYLDGESGRAMAKRFNVKAITRDKEYDLTKGDKNSKILYFSANPNGEAEVVTIKLRQSAKAKKKIFDFDFGELAIKGRSAGGNILTRYPVLNVTLKEVGKSTLGAMKIWMDEVSGRLNTDGRGIYLGGFDTGDQILAIYKTGEYELMELDLNKKFDTKELMHITKFDPDDIVNILYYEGGKEWTMVKRFQIETSTQGQRFLFLSDHKSTKLLYATTEEAPVLHYSYRTKEGKVEETLDIAEFMDVKGWKALGNKLTDYKVTTVKEVKTEEPETTEKKASNKATEGNGKLHAGDTIDFDIEDNGQTKLFD